MAKQSPYYRIYLLTVWQEHNRSPPAMITWRFRLEDPRSGQQRVFADAATLLNALREIASATNAAQTQPGAEE
jgi:hypothetical protein